MYRRFECVYIYIRIHIRVCVQKNIHYTAILGKALKRLWIKFLSIAFHTPLKVTSLSQPFSLLGL